MILITSLYTHYFLINLCQMCMSFICFCLNELRIIKLDSTNTHNLQNGDTENLSDVKTRTNGELENSQAWKLKEYDEQSQIQFLQLPDRLLPTRVCISSSGDLNGICSIYIPFWLLWVACQAYYLLVRLFL